MSLNGAWLEQQPTLEGHGEGAMLGIPGASQCWSVLAHAVQGLPVLAAAQSVQPEISVE